MKNVYPACSVVKVVENGRRRRRGYIYFQYTNKKIFFQIKHNFYKYTTMQFYSDFSNKPINKFKEFLLELKESRTI